MTQLSRASIGTGRNHPRRAQALAHEAGAARRGDCRGLRRGGARRLRADAAVDAVHAGLDPAVQGPRWRWWSRSSAYLCVVRPLLRSVTDEQVALYLEEHEPSLEAAIISAVEAERPGRPAQSPALVRKLVQNAVEKVRALEDGRRVERNPVRRYSGALGGVFAIAAAIFLLGPAYMRHALSALLVISRSVEAAAPYSIEVTPGHSTIPRGADQPVTAKLHGFQADQAVLMIRKNGDRRLRARAADPHRGQVRRDAVRRRRADRVFRRGARRPLAGLHAEGRRHAVRQEARAGVSLPGLHRAAAAQDRRRRRHRRPARHRDPRPRRADDGRRRRRDRRRRQDAGADGGPGRRRADGDRSSPTRTASTGSRSRRRADRAWPARRSTRSTS